MEITKFFILGERLFKSAINPILFFLCNLQKYRYIYNKYQ
jgi:hypothetical protein